MTLLFIVYIALYSAFSFYGAVEEIRSDRQKWVIADNVILPFIFLYFYLASFIITGLNNFYIVLILFIFGAILEYKSTIDEFKLETKKAENSNKNIIYLIFVFVGLITLPGFALGALLLSFNF